MNTPDKDKASGQISLPIDKDSICNLSNCCDMLPEVVAVSPCSILTPSGDDLDAGSPKPDVSGGSLLFKNALAKVTR